MSIRNSSESIFATLFALAESLNTPSTPFTTMSRRFRHFKDVTPDEMPAFFQAQLSGQTSRGGTRGLNVKDASARWCVYLPQSQSLDDVVSPIMNAYYDTLSNGLLVNGVAINTLGGLVRNCFEDGKVFFDEGLLETPSLIVIPITIQTGM